jgi:bifunctional DNase/RNase
MIRVQVHDVLQGVAVKPGAEESSAAAEQVRSNQHRMILLKEESGERVFPIWIGLMEGELLAMHLLQQEIKRPMTYDLLRTLLTLGEMTMEQALIARLHENTYYSNLTVKTPTTTADVDCRPSDASLCGRRGDGAGRKTARYAA